MAFLGAACLLVALALCIAGAIASIAGARRRDERWIAVGRRCVYALAAVLTIAFATLELAFLRSDFSFDTVQQHSSTTTPTFYKATAVWASQEGSLLLWVWLLSIWSAVSLRLARRRLPQITPIATAVLLGFGAFFSMLCVFFVHPFATSADAPPEGFGLTPLLRHPMMTIHPPALYSGYTLATIPFAFAVGALVTGRLDASWIRSTRRFALASWCFLAIGIVLGARWSYTELGWGGYWAWDPVENASLLPWLTGTAFIHSLMIQERRGMLKTWNASLVLATGTLAIMGTFLVRSGILDSIHAFGASTVGVPFLILVTTLIAGSIGLITWRRRLLASEHRLDSLLSREAMFLFNNLVLVALAFAVWWGTFFPLISEALTGTRTSVGPPWFDTYTVPLALVLVALSGLGPVVAWRRATPRRLFRQVRVPLLLAAVAVGAGAVLGGTGHLAALAMFGCGTFALSVAVRELWIAARARQTSAGGRLPRALTGVVQRNRRRYGGYVVHIGIAVLFIGVAASSSFGDERDVRVRPGETFRVGGYDLTYERATAAVSDDRRATGALMTLGAVIDVARDGRHVATLEPQRNYYPSPDARLGSVGRLIAGEPTSEVALASGLRRDLWAAMTPDIGFLEPLIARANERIPAERDDLTLYTLGLFARYYAEKAPAAQFRVIASPMVTWIWIGALLALGGALLAAVPSPRRRAAVAPSREVAEAARDAKLAEIRDAELDRLTGKLDEQDFRAVDGQLRTEAVEILRELDRA